MEHYDLSATHLADKLGIQRSTISHLLSGRNNPSIDLLRRIISNFPDINEAWLLSGHGSPLKQDIKSFKDNVMKDSAQDNSNTNVNKTTIGQTESTDVNSSMLKETDVNNAEIEQILVFYTDGTFKYFRPRK
jgi:DNA-binding XRE family transcriptional regulator